MTIPEINTVAALRRALHGIPGRMPVRIKVWHNDGRRSLRDITVEQQGIDNNLEDGKYAIISTY